MRLRLFRAIAGSDLLPSFPVRCSLFQEGPLPDNRGQLQEACHYSALNTDKPERKLLLRQLFGFDRH